MIPSSALMRRELEDCRRQHVLAKSVIVKMFLYRQVGNICVVYDNLSAFLLPSYLFVNTCTRLRKLSLSLFLSIFFSHTHSLTHMSLSLSHSPPPPPPPSLPLSHSLSPPPLSLSLTLLPSLSFSLCRRCFTKLNVLY